MHDASQARIAIAQVNARITVVRIAAAMFESIPAMPTFANSAVVAANTAESSAQPSHPMLQYYPPRRSHLTRHSAPGHPEVCLSMA